MPNLFEQQDATGIVMRVARLKPTASPVWGSMTVSQMLAHCKAPIEVALGDRELKHTFIGWLFGRMAKNKFMKDEFLQRNLPTDRSFIVKTHPDFEIEKEQLLTLIKRFTEADPESISKRKHPFFGKMTIEEWGVLQWKHLDHHLRQFNS